MQGMKEDILNAGTKFQLGVLFWGIDFKKFFDKEVLVDCMSTLEEAQVDPRIYRNWFRLNQRCSISVVTGSGLTEEG